MTKDQALKFIRRGQRILRLQDWDIELIPIQAEVVNDRQDVALMRTRSLCMEAQLTLAMAHDDESLRQTIWHELAHLLVEALRDVANDLAGQLGPGAEQLAKDGLDTAEERIVERLAKALSELDNAQRVPEKQRVSQPNGD